MPAYKLVCRQCHKVISEGKNFIEAAERVPAETQWVHNAAYCSRACLNEERAFEASRSGTSAANERRGQTRGSGGNHSPQGAKQ